MKNTDRQNQFHFPNSQEFLAVREGIKPVMRVDVSVFKNLENIIELCKVNKLHFKIRPVNRNSTNPVDHAYISKSKSLIEQAHQSEKRNGKKLGELLGYPECCVDSFFKTIKTVKAGGSFVLHSFLETRG
ncbi:MAG: DUF483 domain-containing protein [Candidatus Aenigmatarchaeota archaeon]|nr:MAG: DUF483 domain-containing protein [Candidatus Aenigmarchaeota archaeon]